MEARGPNIPEVIIADILSRLPVKVVMRFKTVGKSWRALISSPFFHKLHLKQSVDQNRLSFMSFPYRSFFHSPLFCEVASSTIKPQSPHREVVEFLASCNGLFCLKNEEHDFFFWNPSTGEMAKIPSMTAVDVPVHFRAWGSIFFGLGYDSALDDYKLVRVAELDDRETAGYQTDVRVYSRNANAWRRIGDFPYKIAKEGVGVFACGRIHWMLHRKFYEGGPVENAIATLDVANESYGLIQLPRIPSKHLRVGVATLDQNLVVFYRQNFWENQYNLWILKEYDGKTSSWTRIVIGPGCGEITLFQPLCLLKPGLILLRIRDKEVVWFDVEKKQFSNVLKLEALECIIVSFVESLVSPSAHN